MTNYEKLVDKAYIKGITVVEMDFSSNTKGLCVNSTIGINKDIETEREKTCVLAEELGHYYTTVGDITKQTTVQARKEENIARRWGFNTILSVKDILSAFKNGCLNRYEMADFLDVTESYLEDATEYFAAKYGNMIELDGYIIKFSPLNIYPKNTLFRIC